MVFDEKFIICLYHCVLLLTADWLLCLCGSISRQHTCISSRPVCQRDICFQPFRVLCLYQPQRWFPAHTLQSVQLSSEVRAGQPCCSGNSGVYQWCLPSLLMWDIKQTDQMCINNSQAFHYAQSFSCFHRDYSMWIIHMQMQVTVNLILCTVLHFHQWPLVMTAQHYMNSLISWNEHLAKLKPE